MKPSCANWNVWLGQEIEGHVHIGVMTLFVRKWPDKPFSLREVRKLMNASDESRSLCMPDRIWFCKEFRQWDTIRRATTLFDPVCVEFTYLDSRLTPYEDKPPADLLDKVNVYVKLPGLDWLPDGSHVCVGKAFSDESFLTGSGNRVDYTQYESDIRLD